MEAKKITRWLILGILLSVAGSVIWATFRISQPDPVTERLNKMAEETSIGLLDAQTLMCQSGFDSNACTRLEQRKREYKEKYGKDYVYDQKRVDENDAKHLQKLFDGCKQGNSDDCENLKADLHLRFGDRSMMQESCLGGQQIACENVQKIDKYLPVEMAQ